MNGMEQLVAEHDNILRLNRVVRTACQAFLDGGKLCIADFRDMIVFIRHYADRHHHGKEEKILFQEMRARLGPLGETLIQHGMLVEHDLARLHVSELEEALGRYEAEGAGTAGLDIIAAAIGYTKLLQRHIDKENRAVYPYAERSLPSEVMEEVNARMEAAEREAQEAGLGQKYLTLLDRLEQRYQEA